MNRRTFLTLAGGGIWLAMMGSGLGGVTGGMRGVVSGDAGPAPSREKPLVLGKEGKSVRIYTEINPKSFEKTNPHWGVVFKNGKLADKGILKAFCSPVAFHDALVRIGARPGNDLTEESTGQSSAGDRLLVTASLPGREEELPLSRVFRDSSGKGFSVRFGGNRRTAEEAGTGCITCLESCWIGITSNAAYPLISGFKRFINPNSLFSGNPDLLTLARDASVILTYKVA